MVAKSSMWNDLQQAWHTKGVLVRLISLNVAVFVGLSVFRFLFVRLGSVPPNTFSEYWAEWLILPAELNKLFVRPWTIISYFFIHESFFHILFNMLFLYWFGRLVWNYLGQNRLLHLYIGGGVVAGLLFVLLFNLFPLPKGTWLLGASGAVYAIVVGVAVYVPNYVVYLFLFGPVRIKYIAIVYLFLSFYRVSAGVNIGGEIAHFGGALWGFFYVSRLKAGHDIGIPLNRWVRAVGELFVTTPRTKKSKKHAKSSKNPSNTYADQEELDVILDKISQSGYESLSKEEKEKLFRLSKK